MKEVVGNIIQTLIIVTGVVAIFFMGFKSCNSSPQHNCSHEMKMDKLSENTFMYTCTKCGYQNEERVMH